MELENFLALVRFARYSSLTLVPRVIIPGSNFTPPRAGEVLPA